MAYDSSAPDDELDGEAYGGDGVDDPNAPDAGAGDQAGGQFPMAATGGTGMATAAPSMVDRLASLRSSLGSEMGDPQGDLAAKIGPPDPSNPRSGVNRLGLALEGPSPMEQAYGQSLKEQQDLNPDYARGRQYDEILNERRAGNDADAQYGDPMAARALSRAMAARVGMGQAADEAATTQLHEQVVKNATEDALTRAQPKEDTAQEANAVKLRIAEMQQQGKISAAQASDLARTADALYGAGAHIVGSGFGETSPGQSMLDQIQQALKARGAAAGTPQYKAGQFKEGQTGTGNDGAKYVWHDAGPKGPNWYPS